MDPSPAERFLQRLLAGVAASDYSILEALIADEVLFHTPRFLKPITSRPQMLTILRSIPVIVEGFHYERTWTAGSEAIMEFKGKVGEVIVHGLDIFTVGADGRAGELTVFLRPTKALAAIGEAEDRLASHFKQQTAG